MVKNKKGGRNHRKQASKNAQPLGKTKLRLPKEEDETVARVEKLLGGGMAHVLCNDNKIRLLQIRKKFRGRNRRDNSINPGSLVLVGMRSWEVRREGKKEKVDLLYVYSLGHIEELKKISTIKKFIFPSDGGAESDNGYDISNTETWEDKVKNQEMLANLKSTKQNLNLKITSTSHQSSMLGDDEDDIDFDDI